MSTKIEAGGGTAVPKPPESRSPVEALGAYLDAINTHDFRNVRRTVHPDAVFWFGDATFESAELARPYFEAAWRAVKGEVYSAVDVRWIGVGDTVAVCTYTYTYEGHHDGLPVRGHGRATNAFATGDDGCWRLAHEHLSGSPEQ